jgi:hypothetical protein
MRHAGGDGAKQALQGSSTQHGRTRRPFFFHFSQAPQAIQQKNVGIRFTTRKAAKMVKRCFRVCGIREAND